MATSARPARLLLTARTAEELRRALPEVAEGTVAAITDEVPSYSDALSGPMGETIRTAVQLALGGFISLAGRAPEGRAQTPTAPAVDGAYQLGRGEARSGRSVDALLSAYRIGARVSWREMSSTAVRTGRGRRDAGQLRRAGLRLHRRALGGQRRGPHRRAGHHRPGAAAAARAAGRPAARGGARRRRSSRRPRRPSGRRRRR